jgi:hypothetical protein
VPASYQLPAALFLLVSGLVACFAGYRFFRFILGLYGFIVGALVGSSLVAAGNTIAVLVAALIGGLAGALVLTLLYFVGVALAGAAGGVVLAQMFYAGLGVEARQVVVLIVAVVGAGLALAFQRYVIIVATAFGGAWTALSVGLALLGNRVAGHAVHLTRADWARHTLAVPSDGWVVVAWVVLSVLGVGVQLASGERRERRRR